MREGGTGRRAAVEKPVANLGGSMEAFYFAFGQTDVYVITDVPDNVTAAAIAMIVSVSGGVNDRPPGA